MAKRVGAMFPCRIPASRLVRLSQEAERSGLDELWVVEDCFYTGGIANAATALAATEAITVGIGVLPTVARNAAIAAMELAALATLHPGRLIAGFGHGVPDWMRQIGEYPPSPLAALRETLSAVRRLLAGEQVTVDGKHVRLDDVRLEFPPAVVPPVFAGVRGPKSLAVSGAEADGTILAEPASPEYLRSALAAIEAGGGDPARHTVVTYTWFAADDDPETAREAVRGTLSRMSAKVAPHVRPLPFGEELLAAIDAGELPAKLRPEWVDRLSVSGTPRQCADRIAELHAAGSDSVVLIPVPGTGEEAAFAAAGEIATAVRSAAG
ncbi:LLM class flavin-dependent oxidoreductase [Amycolatopsis minnesotensis]|uniref:LLM class flavin-dependent oxidoreductase n=1 Tax=Amycolatopsis minnesotensis TaxID=337894 RepID=A0ABN2QK18_9PSEU